MNTSDSREEAEEIFNKAIVELDKYGLLGGLSIKQAQRLVTGGYNNSRFTKLIDILNEKYQVALGESKNLLCLTVGKVDNIGFQGPFALIYNQLFYLIIKSPIGLLLWFLSELSLQLQRLGFDILSGLFDLLLLPFLPLFLLYLYSNYISSFMWFSPIQFFSHIGIGKQQFHAGSHKWILKPATGWIWTIGLNGKKSWNNDMYGQNPLVGAEWINGFYYSGAIGFTGLNIFFEFPFPTSLLIGHTLWINIDETPPDYNWLP